MNTLTDNYRSVANGNALWNVVLHRRGGPGEEEQGEGVVDARGK